MASFGQFSLDTLCVDGCAREQHARATPTYTDTENALVALGAQRDALAGQIRLALWNAEFGGPEDRREAGQGLDQAGQTTCSTRPRRCAGRSDLGSRTPKELDKIKHIVVIYEENHSFDNLYGGWEGVNGLANADAAHTTQVNQAGNAYSCLKQDDVNLNLAAPLTPTCSDSTPATPAARSRARSRTSRSRSTTYIPPTATTCPSSAVLRAGQRHPERPNGLPGGCTRDLVHRFYQEPYQLDGGKQDRYVTGSDAIGLTMGYYDTQALPIYKYLHAKGHPDYAIADDFFQGAFGGSFLNHQWLIAAAAPSWAGALNDGLATTCTRCSTRTGCRTTTRSTPRRSARRSKDQQLTQSCSPAASRPPIQPGFVCGNYAVNTTQPFNQPYSPGTAPTRRLPAADQRHDRRRAVRGRRRLGLVLGRLGQRRRQHERPRLDERERAGLRPTRIPNGCAAAGARASQLDQHLPVLPGRPVPVPPPAVQLLRQLTRRARPAGRTSRTSWTSSSSRSRPTKKTCNLKDVSFIKPIGEENEHPGLRERADRQRPPRRPAVKSIEGTACAKDTMVIVTYDEFGGQWDHVSPPGQGNDNGPHDVWGPGTRIPALVIAPHLKGTFVVDSAEHDTTSILGHHRAPLRARSARDARRGGQRPVDGLQREEAKDTDPHGAERAGRRRRPGFCPTCPSIEA